MCEIIRERERQNRITKTESKTRDGVCVDVEVFLCVLYERRTSKEIVTENNEIREWGNA